MDRLNITADWFFHVSNPTKSSLFFSDSTELTWCEQTWSEHCVLYCLIDVNDMSFLWCVYDAVVFLAVAVVSQSWMLIFKTRCHKLTFMRSLRHNLLTAVCGSQWSKRQTAGSIRWRYMYHWSQVWKRFWRRSAQLTCLIWKHVTRNTCLQRDLLRKNAHESIAVIELSHLLFFEWTTVQQASKSKIWWETSNYWSKHPEMQNLFSVAFMHLRDIISHGES